MSKKMVQRFSESQIAAHGICALSIMALYITGIPLLFPNELGWIPSLIGLAKTMFIHRLAGIGLIGAAVYYLIYIALYWINIDPRSVKNVIPGIHDITDAVKDMLYAVGASDKKPVYRKYNWLEKIDIFSVAVFDAVIMGITGIVIWMPWLSLSVMSKSTILLLKTVHGSFAILSLCGILLHFYIVHLTPSRFPMDHSMFTGKMDAHEAQHEYKLWYDEMSEISDMGEIAGDMK